jgi:hypothetical protein
MSTETRTHREYELTAKEYSPGWQVHIYPIRGGMLKPVPDFVSAQDKEAAFMAAILLIDAHFSK